MPELSIRFAVRDQSGRTTDIWKCWTISGTGKRDVYLTSRPLGRALKLSLHEGGQWHVGFHANRRDELFLSDQLPTSRFLGMWNRPEAGTTPVILAARVLFPSVALSDAHRQAPSDTVWITNAPQGYATEVGIFLINAKTEVINWPGRSQGVQLVGRLPLDGGGQVCVVHRVLSTWPQIPNIQTSLNYFRGKSDKSLVKANRLVAWGEEHDGSISFIEVSVTVQPTGAPKSSFSGLVA